MKHVLPLLLVIGVIFASCSHKRQGKPKILVFSKTMGFHHESIADGNAAIKKLEGKTILMLIQQPTRKCSMMIRLKQYSAVVFLSTTGDVLEITGSGF